MGIRRWRTVKGYKGKYKISNDGLLKSLPRYRKGKGGVSTLVNGQITKGTFDKKSGYFKAHLWKKGKCWTQGIHQLVAAAFVPNPNNLPEVNHKDGVKTNNHWTNFEWTTRLGNAQHASSHGLLKGNTQHRELTVKTVKIIKQHLRDKTKTRRELADDNNVSYHTITDIALGRTWSTRA